MSVVFKPFHYQPRMRCWGVERLNAAFFCSPGLGKTAVSLEVVDDLFLAGEIKGVLIVAPLRVSTLTWPAQIALWNHSEWLKVANMRTAEGLKAWNEGSADIYLINYEMLASRDVTRKCSKCKGKKCATCDFKGLKTTHTAGFVEKCIKKRKEIPVDMIIWDELSICKNPSSKRINSIRPYRHYFKRHLGLTGTPSCNGYLDLFAQVRILDGGERFGNSFTRYRDLYFESDFMGFKFTLRPGAKEKIDAKIADLALVMLSDDYLDVPTCTTTDVEVSLPEAAKKAYKTMEKELLIQLERTDIVALNAATLTGKLLQIVGGAVYDDEKNVEVIHDAKIKALLALRKKHGKEPVLVLTAFKHEMDRVLKAIPGAVKFHERLIPDWRAGKIHTMVCQPQSMSHGIDGLQTGKIAIWFTLTWSNETYIQTNARLVRTGQSQETTIYRLICGGTIDDAVAEALRNKADTQTGLMQALKNLQLLRAA